MSRIVAVTSPDLALGFELAGIATAAARDPHEAGEALRSAVESGEYGIVIVAEDLLDETTKALCEAGGEPLIVTVPGSMKWPREEGRRHDDYAVNLIRRAIGHQLRVRL